MRLRDTEEKYFIKNVLSKYADTANEEKFDDCVVIDLSEMMGVPDLPLLVYSIDHPSHIDKGLEQEESFRFYGRWAAACTCGDVLAMGAQPLGFALDMAAPLDMEVKHIEAIMEGIMQTLNYYDTKYEGGNFDVNHLETVCMAWGVVNRDKIIHRKGARPGDIIVATGNLGTGWSGYLAQKLGIMDDWTEEQKAEVRNYNIMPRAPIAAMKEVFNLGVITSGMDLTDGVVEFFYTISEKNKVGVAVDLSGIEVSEVRKKVGEATQIDPVLFSLEPGYDTPLTHGWTIRSDSWEQVKSIFAKHGAVINKYGIVTEGSQVHMNGKDIPRFWDDQFKKEQLVQRWKEFLAQIK